MSRPRSAVAAAAALLASAWPAVAATRVSLQRDVEGFAVASCLLRQSSPELRAQGHAWASIAVFRSGGELADWSPLKAAVAAESARRPMYIVHREEPVGAGDRPAEVAYCVELLDAPAVRTAVQRMVGRLTRPPRRR